MDKLKRWQKIIVVFFITSIGAGIIGNRADAFFVSYLTSVIPPVLMQIFKAITISPWPLSITFILLLLILCFMLFLLRKQNEALNFMSEIATFDTILLDCLTDLAGAENQEQKEEKTKRILRILLKNAMGSQAAAGHVFRASILLIDPKDPEYLKIWAHSAMPPENITRTAFYIGERNDKVRGVAGETFKDGKLRVAHMIKKEGKWICEHPNYIHFENRSFTPYESFVCVPIIIVTLNRTGNHQRNRIGVVCFDSHNKSVFNNSGTQKLLKSLGERVGAVISLYWELKGDKTKQFAQEETQH